VTRLLRAVLSLPFKLMDKRYTEWANVTGGDE
jgi:hypothetical protein